MSLYVTQVSDGGRIVIPVDIRNKMHIKTGDQLLVSVHDGEIHLATKKQRLKMSQQMVSRYSTDISLADELINERREEDEKK